MNAVRVPGDELSLVRAVFEKDSPLKRDYDTQTMRKHEEQLQRARAHYGSLYAKERAAEARRPWVRIVVRLRLWPKTQDRLLVLERSIDALQRDYDEWNKHREELSDTLRWLRDTVEGRT